MLCYYHTFSTFFACRIVLRFKGKSIDGDESADRIVDILMDNPAELNHDVAEVNSGQSIWLCGIF